MPLLTTLQRDGEAQAQQRAQLFALLQRRQLTDVTLVLAADDSQLNAAFLAEDDEEDDEEDGKSATGQVEVQAHRLVLAAASAFFRALFTSGMRESHEPRVPLPGVDPRAFRALLRYMYLGELALSGDNVLPILVTADRLEMPEVVDECCAQLMLRLAVDNCVDVFVCCRALVHRRACRLLARAARAFMRAFASDVRRTPAFQRNLLAGDASVLHAVGDPSAPATRAPIARRKSDGDYCEVRPMPQKSSPVIRDAEETASGMTNSITQQELPTTLATKPSFDGERTPTIFVIGGFNGPCALKSVELLDFHSGKWFAVENMHEKRSYSGAAVSSAQKIYVMGGASNSRHLDSVEMYDPERNVWTEMPSMPTARSYLGAAFLDGFVYAVGGFNGLSHLRTVERFDVEKQAWEAVAPLKTARSGLAVVVMHNKLVAVGGYDGRQHLASVEVYDSKENLWFDAPAMTTARNGPAAIACARTNTVLVFGGESRHGVRMNSSEALELGGIPIANSETDNNNNAEDDDDDMDGDDSELTEEGNQVSWHGREPFVDTRSGHAAFSFLDESFVFAVGGSHRKDEYLNEVHRFDFVSRSWTFHSRMRAQRCGLNVAVVSVAPNAKCFDTQRQSNQQY